jgi:hypothetical protein
MNEDTGWLQFFAWLIGEVALLNALLLAGFLLTTRLSIVAANVMNVVLCVGLVVLALSYKRLSLTWTALVVLVGGIICGLSLREYREAASGEIVKGISLHEASRHPKATGFSFADAGVRTDLSAVYEEHIRPTGRTYTTHFYYVAPVVITGWNESSPVEVWAACRNVNDEKAWEVPFKAGLRPPPWDESGYREAVGFAVQNHKLIASPEPVILLWVESPERALAGLLSDFWFGVRFWNVALIAGLLAGRLMFTLTRRNRSVRDLHG